MEFPPYTKTSHRGAYPAIDPKSPDNSAAGKVVLVTGGGSGIGKSVAKAFVQAGAKAVAILGRREKVLLEAAEDLKKHGSAKILTFVADVLDKPALDKAFQKTAQEAGNIDVLIANAGYLAELTPMVQTDVADWWKSFEVNIKGLLLTYQAWHPHIGSNSPILIALNTAAAHFGAFPGFSSYSSAKAGAARLVESIQAETPEIRAVSIHPGAIETDMYTKANLPIPPNNIDLPASFSVWLAANGSEWVKGRLLWVEWDVKELEAMKDGIVAQDELKLQLSGWPKQHL